VAHGVGHREVQHVALHREVEAVAGDLARGLQPGGERELPRLASEGIREQPMLDLSGERERDGTLAPLEEIGKPAIGDDDIGEGVCREGDVGQRLLVGRLSQAELQHTDGLPPIGDRREHARSLGCVVHHQALSEERRAVRAARQGHALRGFPTLGPRVLIAPGVSEPDERPTAEIGNQQGHPRRAEGVCEALANDVGGGDGRRILDGHQELGEVQSRPSPVAHPTSLRLRQAKPRRGAPTTQQRGAART
jgi:hypothetical protein